MTRSQKQFVLTSLLFSLLVGMEVVGSAATAPVPSATASSKAAPTLSANSAVNSYAPKPTLAASQPRDAMNVNLPADQFPIFAVDPTGKWVVQAAPTGSQPASVVVYQFNVYKLVSDGVLFQQSISLPVKEPYSNVARIHSFAFSADGTSLWVAFGAQGQGQINSNWVARVDTTTWTTKFSAHPGCTTLQDFPSCNYLFGQIAVLKSGNSEKLVAAVPRGTNTIVVVNASNPTVAEPHVLPFKVAQNPGANLTPVDVTVRGNLLYLGGWANNAVIKSPDPRLSFEVVNTDDWSVSKGPFVVPDVAGIVYFKNDRLSSFRLRISASSQTAWMISQEMLPPAPQNNSGSTTSPGNTSLSGIARVDLASGKSTVQTITTVPGAAAYDALEDLVEVGAKTYVTKFTRGQTGQGTKSLVQYDVNLQPTSNVYTLPTNWGGPIAYVEKHPLRNDVIFSTAQPNGNPAMYYNAISLYAPQ